MIYYFVDDYCMLCAMFSNLEAQSLKLQILVPISTTLCAPIMKTMAYDVDSSQCILGSMSKHNRENFTLSMF